MARVNTEKMIKVMANGKEYAFGKARKNEYGEWVIKVYIDGYYSEDCTIYADSKEDAEASMASDIANMTKKEAEAVEAKAEEKKEEVKAVAEYNDIMFAICREYLTIGTSFSENTEGWNLRDMVAEADYQLSFYNEKGHWLHDEMKKEDNNKWRRETGLLKRFIAKYKAEAMTMMATEGHCSRFDN